MVYDVKAKQLTAQPEESSARITRRMYSLQNRVCLKQTRTLGKACTNVSAQRHTVASVFAHSHTVNIHTLSGMTMSTAPSSKSD